MPAKKRATLDVFQICRIALLHVGDEDTNRRQIEMHPFQDYYEKYYLRDRK
jgi:hypothetical protein